jgi:hypothetical protein
MSCDGLSTTVSSRELFFRAIVVVEGRTTVVAFFGLSSSLKENHLSSRTGEDQNKETVGNKSQIKLMSQVIQTWKGQNPWKLFAPTVHLLG